jgi:8-oxo-dGTP diphosphatase
LEIWHRENAVALEGWEKPLATASPLASHCPPMLLPYKIATLLYCFNERDEVLLLERAQEPNLGLWSPCGGKLHADSGESPYACACREAAEEISLLIAPSDLHLTGIVSEHGYQGHSHWLMFLFEVKKKLTSLPAVHREGRFEFFSRTALAQLKLPLTDHEKIWPWFWEHRSGFFAAHCHCHPDGRNEWTLEESRQTSTINRQS